MTAPDKGNLMQIARRERKQANAFQLPDNPKNASKLEIPEELREYEQGLAFNLQLILSCHLGLFYRGRCGSNEKPIFVFASNLGLDLLAKNKKWFGDGTFSIVPEIFYQLYTICVQWNGSQKVIPVVYALMTNKDTESYITLFNFLKVCVLFQFLTL
jgi:hypothetical protein